MEKQAVKVIHMAPLGSGGITKLTVSIDMLLDHDKVRFDYLVFRDRHEFMEDAILALHEQKQVVDLEGIRSPLLRFHRKFSGMRALFRREGYDVVHVDASTPCDVTVAIAARLSGVPVIVLHAHNDNLHPDGSLKDRLKILLLPLFRRLMPLFCTDYFAVSGQAAAFMFPPAVLRAQRFTLVRNGIDAEACAFSEAVRQRERTALDLPEETFVLGSVGRFVWQKNHTFMLQVFRCLHAAHPDTRLLLVGEGELEAELRAAAARDLPDHAVIFYGITRDVPAVLSAMDAFLFPSRFEGLGMAVLEAQASGLPVWCAETIPEEAAVCEQFHRIAGWDPEEWAAEIWKQHILELQPRRSRTAEVQAAGCDIRGTAAWMQAFYLRRTGRSGPAPAQEA